MSRTMHATHTKIRALVTSGALALLAVSLLAGPVQAGSGHAPPTPYVPSGTPPTDGQVCRVLPWALGYDDFACWPIVPSAILNAPAAKAPMEPRPCAVVAFLFPNVMLRCSDAIYYGIVGSVKA